MNAASRLHPLLAALCLVAVLPGARGASAAPPALAPDRAERIAVGDHELWVEVYGDLGTGQTPVLLLHGGMMTIALTFAGLIPGLADDRPVIGIEQQAHGRTADRDSPITLESMRTDTLGVLDALGVRRAHVVGFSMGGMLGLELAVNAPDRVASLTAISASQSNRGMLPDVVRMNRDPHFTPSPEVAALLPSEADFAAMQKGFADNPDGPQAWAHTMAKLGSFITSDWGWSDEQLSGMTAPVQVVVGDNDFMRPAHAAHMAGTIPGAFLAVLPDTTHMSMMTRTELLGPIIEHRIATAGAE